MYVYSIYDSSTIYEQYTCMILVFASLCVQMSPFPNEKGVMYDLHTFNILPVVFESIVVQSVPET